jgi:hypothetical protein
VLSGSAASLVLWVSCTPPQQPSMFTASGPVPHAQQQAACCVLLLLHAV